MKNKKIENLFYEFINEKPDFNNMNVWSQKYNILASDIIRKLNPYSTKYGSEQEIKLYDQRVQFYKIKFNMQTLKYIYDYCNIHNWKFSDIQKLAEKLNSSVTTLEKYAKIYAINVLNLDQDEIEKKIKDAKRKVNSEKRTLITSKRFITLYNNVLEAKNTNEVVKLCIDFKASTTDLKQLIKSYSRKIAMETDYSYEYVFHQVNSKFEPYFLYLNETKKKSNEYEYMKLKKAQNVINEFLLNNLNKEEFCKEQNFTLSNFSRHCAMVKNQDPDLYNKYLQKIDNIKQQRVNKVKPELMILINWLKNGINENNIKRPFDVVDYYALINISFDDIITVSKELLNLNHISKNEYILIKTFMSNIGYNLETKFLQVTPFSEQTINDRINEYSEINCKLNVEGYPIKGSGRIITTDEKIFAFNFLYTNNIPINSKSYNATIKRILNNYLLINEQNSKQLKLKSH